MWRLRRVRDDAGITMAELLVAAAVSAIILVALGGFFTATIRGSATNAATDTNVRQATNAINAMSRYLRAATTRAVSTGLTPDPAIVRATPTDLTFYAYINLVDDPDIAARTAEKPVLVRYSLDASKQLVQQLSACTADANGYYSCPAVTSTTRIGGPVASPTWNLPDRSDSADLFSYQDADGNALSTATGTLSDADRAAVRFVTVNLELGSTTAGKPGDAHLQNTVGLLNLGRAGASS